MLYRYSLTLLVVYDADSVKHSLQKLSLFFLFKSISDRGLFSMVCIIECCTKYTNVCFDCSILFAFLLIAFASYVHGPRCMACDVNMHEDLQKTKKPCVPRSNLWKSS